VITKEGRQYLRPYDVANEKGVRQGKYSYKRGATGGFNANAKVCKSKKFFYKYT